jgi:hypothetical protein
MNRPIQPSTWTPKVADVSRRRRTSATRVWSSSKRATDSTSPRESRSSVSVVQPLEINDLDVVSACRVGEQVLIEGRADEQQP